MIFNSGREQIWIDAALCSSRPWVRAMRTGEPPGSAGQIPASALPGKPMRKITPESGVLVSHLRLTRPGSSVSLGGTLIRRLKELFPEVV